MKLHHVGIAVESLEDAVPVFERLLGCLPLCAERVGEQKVRVVVFEVGESRIELLEAEGQNSPIGRFIAKRGPGMHHLTLTVPDLEQALRDMERSGIQPVDQRPRVGAEGRRIAFLDPKSTAGVLIELMEDKE